MARSRRWETENRARKVLEKQFQIMDTNERKNKPRPEPVRGKRAIFMEKYKLEGYQAAKILINKEFGGKEVYDDETLKGWIAEEKEQ